MKHANRREQRVSEHLFLDVYVANESAIRCYTKCGFRILNAAAPFYDEQENHAPYYVMAKALNRIPLS